MAAWIGPMTWADGNTPTAAQYNAEIRDHLIWLKAALDQITGATAADSGDSTYLRLARATSGVAVFRALVTGDTQYRLEIHSNGVINWGDGASAMDVNLYRRGVDTLATSDSFQVVNSVGIITFGSGNTVIRNYLVDGDTQPSWRVLHANGEIQWGAGGSSAPDVNLYRPAADTLKTDDGLWAVGGLITKTKAGVPVDGDLAGGMTVSGAMILDTTNSRIYFRVGTTWKYAALT